MKLRLFVEDIKGYMDIYDSVDSVKITRVNNKNTLQVFLQTKKEPICILLSEINLCYLIDLETMHEYFRYAKANN